MIITRNTAQIPDALMKAHQSTQSFYRVAAIQMASGPKVQANLEEAGRLIDMACSIGVLLLEIWCFNRFRAGRPGVLDSIDLGFPGWAEVRARSAAPTFT